MTRVFVSAVIAVAVSAAQAAQVTTTLAGSPREPESFAAHARRIDGQVDPIELVLSVPGTTTFALPDGLWEVRLSDHRLWADPIHVRNTDVATLKAWRSMRLVGTSNLGTAMGVEFTSVLPDGPKGEVECSIDEGRWVCLLPTGRYDLRFSSPGWVPEFRFGFDVAAAGGSDLRLQFVKGASLSGWIEAVARRETVEGTEVSLAVEAREQRRKLYLARANAKGWFQFKGIPPGEYLLSASRSRFVSQVHSVKILADRAADLRVPLVLDEPKRLTVQIMPPLDHDGLPWKVRLTRNDPRLRFSDVVAEASASNAGEWQREGLIGGTYDVEILCAKGGIWGDGATWTHQDITIGAEDVTVVVNASPRTLTGRITLGGRPLQSAIQFGGVDGPKLQTDEKGRFAGAIPPGDAAEPQQIIIEADTPQVRRTLMRTIETNDEGRAYLEVDLPATTLMGKVIREDRSPVPQAILNFSGEDHVLDQLMSAGDGGFQIAGLAAGKYRISVDAGDLAGDVYPVILEEGEIVETDLVVKPIVKVSGRITGPGDVPVVAAKVLLFSRDAWHSLLSPRFTNGDGLFEFTLPPGTTMYDGIAAHPAFDVVMARAKIHEGQSIRIRTAQLGGTVTIEAKDPGRLYVVYAGARIPVSVVARMAGGAVELERATLPRMRPGHYSVCNGETLHCVRGDLPPHGSLTLKMDEQAAASVR